MDRAHKRSMARKDVEQSERLDPFEVQGLQSVLLAVTLLLLAMKLVMSLEAKQLPRQHFPILDSMLLRLLHESYHLLAKVGQGYPNEASHGMRIEHYQLEQRSAISPRRLESAPVRCSYVSCQTDAAI